MTTPATSPSAHSAGLRHSLRLGVWEGVMRATGLSLCKGVFLAGFAAAAGADSRAMGLIAAMPFAGQLFHLVSAQIVNIAGGRRSVFIVANVLSTLIWAGVVAVAFCLSPSPMLVWGFVVIYGMSAFCNATRQLAWLSWMRDLVPSSIRGRYFARRNRLVMLAGIALSIPAAYFVDRFRRAWPMSGTESYGYVFGVAAILVGLSTLLARRMDEPPMTRIGSHDLWKTALRSAWRSGPFRRYFFFRTYMNFAMATSGPLFVFYLIRELRYPSAAVAGLNVLATVVAAATLILWGRMGDRFGYRPCMLLTFTIKAVWCGLWIFVARDSYPLLVGIYVLGAVAMGNAMLHNNMLMKLVPGEGTAASFALFNSLTRTASMLGPICGGLLVHSFLPRELTVFGRTFSNWHLLFSLSAVLRATGVIGLYWVHEPGSVPLRHFIRIFFRGFSPDEPLRTIAEEVGEDTED